jgi:hypothetical protein
MATIVLSLGLTPLASATQAAITSPFKARTTVMLAPGIKYQQGTMTTTGGHPQVVHVATVEVARDDVKLKALLSNDRVVRRDVVTNIAVGKRRPGLRPMVATNGDMSMRDRVDAYAAPHSMAVSNGELLVSQACVRPTIGIDPDGEAHVSNVRAEVAVDRPSWLFPERINRVNTQRDDGGVVLYTPRFASRTQTSPGGIEVVLDLDGRLRANGSQQVTVLKVRRGAGNTPLRAGQAVLSVKNPERQWVYRLGIGQHLTLSSRIVRKADLKCGGLAKPARGWEEVTEAQGGNYFTLLENRIAAPASATYAPGSERHPRSNVGVTADGRVLMVTVDGRRAGSDGMTLAEMGQLMQSLGAVHAFNLDGGGSAVMARFNRSTGTFGVANKPSDGRQRPATQAFVAFAAR